MARRYLVTSVALALGAVAAAAAAPVAPAAPAGPATAAERGARLFQDPTLGHNGKACVSCHRDGARLDPEELGALSDAKLGAYVNSCIEGMLKGKPLPEGSPDLAALVLHLRRLRPRAR